MTATIPLYNVTKFRPAFDTVSAFTSDQTLSYTVSDAASGLYRVDVGDKLFVGGYLVEVLSSGSTGDLANNSSTPVQVALTRNVIMDARQFGSIDVTGATDASSVIQDAADYMRTEAAGGTLYIPGNPLLSSAVDFSGNYSVQMDGGNTAAGFKVTDSSLLEPVTFGATATFGGRVTGVNVYRSAYSGATDNIGMALYDVAGATFLDCDSRYSKYPVRIKPGNSQRVAYTTFVNLRATGGLYNISTDLSGTGYANELVFLGGRLFDTSDTTTQVYVDDNVNHWRFFAMSMEGTGDQAVYLNGTSASGIHSMVFDQCRTEGTWSNDDIVFGSNTARCEVRGKNLYTTVTDGGTDNKIETGSGTTESVSENGATVRTIRSGSTTDAITLQVRSVRDTAAHRAIKGTRDSDGVERFYTSSRGDYYGLTIHVEGADATDPGLRIDDVRVWDYLGYLLMKNGAPSGNTDGDYFTVSDGTTGGTGSAGAGNQYVELDIGGTVYKVLHDGTV